MTQRLRPSALRAGVAACLATAVDLPCPGNAARAEDGLRPGAGSPFAVRAAFPQSAGDLKLQGILGYDRGWDRSDQYRTSANLKYGLGSGVELRLAGSYLFGARSPAGPGDVATGVRWKAFDQQGWRPAVAFLGEVTTPFGSTDEGPGTELTAIASRTTGRGPGHWGLHLNVGWLAGLDPDGDERGHGYGLGGAVSHVLNEDMLLVAAYAQETQDRDEHDLRIVEGGFEQRLHENATFAFVVGTGLNDDSPMLRLRAGLSWTFSTGR